jgi:phage tail-like protein
MPGPSFARAYASYHFGVEIDGLSGPQAFFTECSGLQIEIETLDWAEGGLNDHVHKLPGRVKHQPLVLKVGLTLSNALWMWYQRVLRGKLDRKTVTVSLYDQTRQQAVGEWTFQNALPVKWVGPTLKADEQSAAILTLEFAHEGIVVSS